MKRRHPRTTASAIATITATFAVTTSAASTAVLSFEVGMWGGVVVRCHCDVVQPAVVGLRVDNQVVARMAQSDALLKAAA